MLQQITGYQLLYREFGRQLHLPSPSSAFMKPYDKAVFILGLFHRINLNPVSGYFHDFSLIGKLSRNCLCRKVKTAGCFNGSSFRHAAFMGIQGIGKFMCPFIGFCIRIYRTLQQA